MHSLTLVFTDFILNINNQRVIISISPEGSFSYYFQAPRLAKAEEAVCGVSFQEYTLVFGCA